ncbi:ArsR/SmtB family transcription factor [Pelagovum pacificum]|uniref:Helix-turn-helix transcriptional regulator n=1 Tax=Pelagovum pacificum TaxID=2588711 RepID=A0A5C5G913_9RHOB|nr:metalloregulator ArsR/SmtB family transcription factor [Pelagovum pacificum]QQA42120.1 helix-turn-helix transcriptional regulator [Pelagovum pacificum]TNY31208.1 helix-turn-helix transcriptional regulator [Pelagovum pacificum]
MNEHAAISAFGALSQETRLQIVRALVSAGPEGMTAGLLGEAVGGVSSSRLAFHLSHLERGGLVTSDREGRFVRYRIRFDTLSDLIGFLVNDCCGGAPGLCLTEIPLPTDATR